MYHNLIFLPLYNILVGIMDFVPGVGVGLAVVIFTVLIRVILYPLSKSSLLTQVRMKEIEPEVNRIKAQYATDRQVQAVKVMELYKSKKIKPFSGILLLFIQLPILFALISVFYKVTPVVHPEFLYSFIGIPQISNTFFGLDLSQKSLILAIITAISQFLQLHFSIASSQHRKQKAQNPGQVPGDDFASRMTHSMNTQMKFLLPILAFVSTYWIIPAKFPEAAPIIAIYWSTSALFSLAQELYIRKKYLSANEASTNEVKRP